MNQQPGQGGVHNQGPGHANNAQDVWGRYTLTGVAGVLAGVMTTFTSMSFTNASEIASLKAQCVVMQDQLRRIESKLDVAAHRRGE